jgi:hypothetical protein
MALRDRIGIDIGRRLRLEDAVEWAAHSRGPIYRHPARHRRECVAEYSPYVTDAVDQYLKGYIDAYGKLGAQWIVAHAGYHFTIRSCG